MRFRTRVFHAVVMTALWTLPASAAVQITVYNEDLALVKDTRPLTFQKGRFELAFTDVAAAIDPTSVAFTLRQSPESVSLLEQNFRYDLVSSEKVLEKYIDRPVRVTTRQDQLHEGTLMAVDAKSLTLQMPDKSIRIISREQAADVSLARLPEGLITRPTLVWSLDSRVDGERQAEVRYLTSRIGWHAEYVATVSPDETRLNLGGWVSIDNQTGATYEDATIKLIAGDVNRVRDDRFPTPRMAMMAMEKADQGFEEKAFFEYHLYTLKRPSTLRDKEIKQLALFDPVDVTAVKRFTYDGARQAAKVRVTMEFDNSSAAGLGIPLPMGKIRVMKADTDGSLEFIGEDRIDHTPKDEKVRVTLGNAFDIVGERIHKDHRQITRQTTEDDFEIILRNHKTTAVSVLAVERAWGDWTIIQSSIPHVKKDASTIEWTVPVPADGETRLTFTIRRTM